MNTLYLCCENNRILVGKETDLYSGSLNFDRISVSFGTDWADFKKTAVFYACPESVYNVEIDNDGLAVIPYEVLTVDGYLHIGIYGEKTEDTLSIRRTTSILRIRIRAGSFIGGLTPSGKDVYSQLQEMLDKKVDKVEGKALSANDFTDEYKQALDGLDEDLEKKVDKVTGKGLSTNDFTDDEKTKLDNLPDNTALTTSLGKKVDKVTGKGLSTNDFTNAYKQTLDGLNTALGKKVDKVEGKGLSTEDYTTAEKTKLGKYPANPPESLKNPNVVEFEFSEETLSSLDPVSYDGSEEKTVVLPDCTTGDINGLLTEYYAFLCEITPEEKEV